ncbi:MAG TPA: ATP-binding protein [Gammaproteobacteria bacterium]
MSGSLNQTPTRLIETQWDRLVDFVNTATIGLHWIGLDGTLLWANPADYEPLGYTAAEYIGRNIADFHADSAVPKDMLARLKRAERLKEYSARLRCKDGSIREVRITCSPMLESDGNIANAYCFTRDVSGEIAAEERLRLLGEASNLLSSSLDLEVTLASLVKLCVPRLADWCAVEILGEDGGPQQLAVAHVDPDKVKLARELRRRFPPDPDAARGVAHVLRTGEAEYLEEIPHGLLKDVARSPEHEEILRSLGLSSYIIVPIALLNRVLGALTLVSAESRRRYSQRDVEMAQELAARAAQAIEHARLYREANQARQDAEDAARRLGLLSSLSEVIPPTLEPDEALRRLAGFVVSKLADYCIAYTLEDDSTIRRVALAHADSSQQRLVEDLVRAGPPSLTDPYGAGAVLRTGEPILATEIPGEFLQRAAQNAEHLRVLQQLAPRSSLIVPLKTRNRTLGALALATTDGSGRRYHTDDLALAQALAGRAALLVDNARLFHTAQQMTHARDQVLSIVSHDLRSPLNTIVTACDLLELDLPEDRAARTRAGIRRATRQMNRLLGDLLDVAQIEEGRLTLHREPVDITLLLDEVISLHDPVADYHGIRLEKDLSDGNFELNCDRNRLCQALSNLVDNALKFTPEGGSIRLAAKLRTDSVCISVSDSGPGIPDHQLPHLFERFWRSGGTKKPGVGLGLAITKGIVEAHGGSIKAANGPVNGAQFTLHLPKPGIPPAS